MVLAVVNVLSFLMGTMSGPVESFTLGARLPIRLAAVDLLKNSVLYDSSRVSFCSVFVSMAWEAFVSGGGKGLGLMGSSSDYV